MNVVFTEVHVGIDDLDSPSGGCTTHAAYRLVKELINRYGARFIDYPNLVRLNPAIPFKTRGNGAVALRFTIPERKFSEISAFIIKFLTDYANELPHRPETEPGIVIVKGRPGEEFRAIYLKALTDYVPPDIVMSILKESRDITWHPSKWSRGLVGATAAVGWLPPHDCTYELLIYRLNCGSERCVDRDSVIAMDKETRGETFLNIDPESSRVLITPGGPDPVLCGVRGSRPEVLLRALSIIKVCEPVEGWAIFRTNQHTDAHHVVREAGSIRAFQTGCVSGTVSSKPVTLEGGATLVRVCDSSGCVHVASFRESRLSSVLQHVRVGDVIKACGSAKFWEGIGTVLQAEKIVLRYVPRYVARNPRCPVCGRRLKSLGRSGGLKCVGCGFRVAGKWVEYVPVERGVEEGLYLPPPKSFKHLMKPLERYGREHLYTELKAPWTEWIK